MRDLVAAQGNHFPELEELAEATLAELRAADVPALLGANATLDNWMPSLTLHFTYGAAQDDNGYTPWPEVTRVQGPVPEQRAPRLSPRWRRAPQGGNCRCRRGHGGTRLPRISCRR